MTPKVSVIIPVYKVEKFIARCAESLLSQTLENVEFIFVDDASPDGSIGLVEECMARHPERNARILVHPENKGLPAARNTGLAAASGEYVFHCDSDDYADPGMLESMYGEAVRNDADIVWCDWYLTFGHNERYMTQPAYGSPMEALKGMLSGAMKFNVWNKLARRSLYTDNSITFPAGYGMGEDMTMMMLFACAKKVTYFPVAFYHYVKTNTEAFSRTYSDRHLAELRYNIDRIEQYMKTRFGGRLYTELAFLKLDAKFPFLLSGDSSKLKLWTEWYPEANRYIMRNRRISLRSRLLQWLAWKGQFWAVRLYGFVFNKVIYGIIYR